MELIPVFSLIVLVATAATFVLAVGAYVMYKLRERSERKERLAPSVPYDRSVEAEVLAPALYVVNQPPAHLSTRVSAREYPPEGHGPPPSNPTEEQKKWR